MNPFSRVGLSTSCYFFLSSVFLSISAFAQFWEAVPQVTAEARAAGIAGGEGCQWPQAIASDATGKRLLFGTDVGGIYRSEDSGVTWVPSNTGLDPRGASAFAFDPINSDRALVVTGNSIEQPFHGIYLSVDGGVSWKNTQPYGNLGYRDFREQVAFDRTTSDAGAKMTRVAYWSAAKTKQRGAGFFKTEDGGTTWREIAGVGLFLGDSIIKTHSTKGWVYAASKKGFFISKDGGATFQKVISESVTGLDVVPAKPDHVFISTAKDVQISADAGNSFAKIASTAFPPTEKSGVKRLRVSPADPLQMLIENDEGSYQAHRFVTHDGGITWEKTKFDVKNSFIPNNNRQMVVAWHPTDPTMAWSIGGDFITRSTDKGKTWAWSGSGYTGLMVGHGFQFNATNPDLVFVPSQDYDGSVSSDAGHTWKYTGVSGEGWGGYTYGGYGFSTDYIVGGSRTSWGGKTELRFNDHGKVIKTGIELKGVAIGTGDPTDPNIAFLFNHRTTDGGKTWQEMPDCRGVLTIDPTDKTKLYGVFKSSAILSKDHGVTWTKVTDLPQSDVRDMAVDPTQNGLYLVSNDDTLYFWSFQEAKLENITARLPADQFGNRGAWSVATDPVDSSIVYVVRPGNTYAKDTSTVRSTDSGKTFVSLNRSLRLGTGLDGPDGGREAMWVRVHPTNRYAYTASNCYGLWRIAPPK